MRSKKEIEFLKLKQVKMTVYEYVAKFEELVKFCPYYNGAVFGWSKCVEFESGLRPEIKQGIGYQKTHSFSMLVNKCRIYDEDNIACFAQYKSLSENKGKNQYYGKLYSDIADKGKQKASEEKRSSG